MDTIALLTSGGDAPGMNDAIRGVVRTARHEGLKVYGVRRGYEGLIDGEFTEMSTQAVGSILEKGGTILRTYRSKKFKSDSGQKKAIENLNQYDVDGLVTIGGDGTFRGARLLDERWSGNVVGIPASIDNDIAGTDYAIGFNTAVSTALNAVDHIRDTATSHERTFIVEVMGRDSGHIAITVGLAGGAEEILIPEVDFSADAIANRIRNERTGGKLHYIIVLAEGAASGFNLSETLERKTDMQTRLVVLGHVQRGGDPSPWDRIAGGKMGYYAVGSLLDGKSGISIGLKDGRERLASLEDAIRGKSIDEKDLEIAGVLSR